MEGPGSYELGLFCIACILCILCILCTIHTCMVRFCSVWKFIGKVWLTWYEHM